MKVMEVQLIVPAKSVAYQCAVDVKVLASHAIIQLVEYTPIQGDTFKVRVVVKDGQVGAWVANNISHAMKQKGYRVTGFTEPDALTARDILGVEAVGLPV